MSAFDNIYPCYAPLPRGLVKTVGAAHTRVRHGQGCRRRLRLNPCTPTTERWVASKPVKAKCYAVASQALTGFPAPSASDRFAIPTEMERGQGRRSRAFHP